jgi:putative transposase
LIISSERAFSKPKVSVSQVDEHIWRVSFMDCDLGYFDDEACRLEPIKNPFWWKVLLGRDPL